MIPTVRITGVRFALEGSEDSIRDSCVTVSTHDLFRDGAPYPGGAYDAHLGTTDHSYRCQTCIHTKRDCLGHSGTYDLAYPVYSPCALEDMRKWIRLICFKCGAPCVDPAAVKSVPDRDKLTELSKIARSRAWDCPCCNTKHPQIRKDLKEPLLLRAEYFDSQGKAITHSEDLLPHHVLEILSRVTTETVTLCGKPPHIHPRNSVLNTIRIPPTSIRPDVKKINGGRSTNDYLTTMLQIIIKHNTSLPTILPPSIDDKLKASIMMLQNKYFEFIKGTSESDSNSVFQRLKGKGGRFRKNQLGKRVRGMGRSTIVGDPRLQIDQIGIPLAHARILQKEEVVQAFNYERLMQYVHNGTHTYPGCSKVVRDGVEYNIDTAKDIVLQVGDVLHRDYVDGDIFDFNRQPSLTISSISTMRVVIYRDPSIKVFGMNVLTCVYFNADFDGDQMNIIGYASIPAQVEAQELSAIQNWTISHTTASPTSGQADDSVIGLFELTRSGVKFDRYHAAMLFQNCTWMPELTEKTYTGRDIISILLSRTPVSLARAAEWYQPALAPYIDYDPSETHVVIRRGKHISGVLDKKTIGKGVSGSLYHIIANDYGNEAALACMFNMQQVAIAYILQFGYTIGVRDLYLTEAAAAQVQQITTDIMTKSDLITEQLTRGEIIPPIDKTTGEFYEQLQINTLSLLDEFVEPIVGSIDHRKNNLFKMIACGDKGKFDNMCNMKSAIGQKLINGERMRMTFGHARTLPYFPRFDTSALARGYITNSYCVGMTSSEYVFNAMASRFDLISKALSTSVTGEQNRKSIKNLESIIINNYRCAVKNKSIISLAYGGDFLDPRKLERVTFAQVMMPAAELEEWVGDSGDYLTAVRDDVDKYLNIFGRLEATNTKEMLSPERLIAFNAQRILDAVLLEVGPAPKATKAQIEAAGARVLAFSRSFGGYVTGSGKNGSIPAWVDNAVWLPGMHVRATLRPSILPTVHHCLDRIIEAITHRFLMALIDPGTAAGIIAAQSFSEPFTQYMLDAHHRSASGGTSKSGMTRFKEVLGSKPLSKTANPTMYMETTCATQEEAQRLANSIEMMQFAQFVSRWQVFYEKFGQPTHPDTVADSEWIAAFTRGNVLIPVPGDLTRWCLRFTISPMTLMLKGMSIELIAMRLRMVFPDMYIAYTPENSRNIILRAYARGNMFKSGAATSDMIKIAEAMLQITIRGVENVLTATPVKLIRHVKSESGPKRVDVWGIQTSGCNIRGVLLFPQVRGDTLVSNVVQEMHRVFGIEAARQRIIYEMRSIVDKCNYRHYQVYANEMTFTGAVTSIENIGLRQREASNVLLRVGFSSPIVTLEDAAANGTYDHVTGITAPLLLGSVPRHGSLYNQFYINCDFVEKNTKTADSILDEL